MKALELWTKQDYYQYIKTNYLHQFWYDFLNPIEGKRLLSIIFNPTASKAYPMKCPKCGVDMSFEESGYSFVCPSCRGRKTKLIRNWKEDGVFKKLYAESELKILKLAPLSKVWYFSLGVWKDSIISRDAEYSEQNLRNFTLGIDIDLKDGILIEPKNQEAMVKTIDFIREKLNSIVPNSYHLQTSGNGIYFLIHHALVNKDFLQTLYQWRIFVENLNRDKPSNLIEIECGGDFSRVFKLVGSLHKTYPYIAIPLDRDVNFAKFNLKSESYLPNFNFRKYRTNLDGRWSTDFYQEYDLNESVALYNFLKEIKIENPDKEKQRQNLMTESITEERVKSIASFHHPSYSSLEKVYIPNDILRNLEFVDEIFATRNKAKAILEIKTILKLLFKESMEDIKNVEKTNIESTNQNKN